MTTLEQTYTPSHLALLLTSSAVSMSLPRTHGHVVTLLQLTFLLPDIIIITGSYKTESNELVLGWRHGVLGSTPP